jgi:hypothetical protein
MIAGYRLLSGSRRSCKRFAGIVFSPVGIVSEDDRL